MSIRQRQLAHAFPISTADKIETIECTDVRCDDGVIAVPKRATPSMSNIFELLGHFLDSFVKPRTASSFFTAPKPFVVVTATRVLGGGGNIDRCVQLGLGELPNHCV